jgi:hypothetical protein
MESVGCRRGRQWIRSREESERRAWGYYRAVLRGREGREYEQLEPVVWEELQRELAELDQHLAVRR